MINQHGGRVAFCFLSLKVRIDKKREEETDGPVKAQEGEFWGGVWGLYSWSTTGLLYASRDLVNGPKQTDLNLKLRNCQSQFE